jgi:hypothetical protein
MNCKVMLVGLLVAHSLLTAPAWGSVIWAGDSGGEIFTVNTITGATTMIGNAGVVLTDIAFDPWGNLWGVSFTDFYSINTSSGVATPIGSLGQSQMNALVSDAAGNLLGAMNLGSTQLFSINSSTGATTAIGTGIGINSSGDLEFAGTSLYLSGDAVLDELWSVDAVTGAGAAIGGFGVDDMFGLAFQDGVMWGVAGTSIYSIDLITGAASLSTSYSGPSVAFGASRTIVPEPGTLSMLGLGITLVAISRRQRRTRHH